MDALFYKLMKSLQTKMTDWLLNDRETFLDELIWHQGLGASTEPDPCNDCKVGLGVYRCMECMGTPMYCKGCLLTRHGSSPLHRIEVRSCC